MLARRRRSLALAVVASAALTPVALAHAARIPTIDVWSGKTHRKHDGMFISNVRGNTAVSIQITATCLATDGTKMPTSFSVNGRLLNGRVTVINQKAGANSTLTVTARLPRTRAATGTVRWNQAANATTQACAGGDTFKLKHAISHGG